MKLTTKLLTLVFSTILIVVVLYGLLISNRVQDHLRENQIQWVDTLVKSISESIAQDTINNKQLHVKELLIKIVESDDAIEFAFVTDMDGELFAHSFIGGFPRFLATKDYQRNYSESDSVIKYNSDRGLIVEYRTHLVTGLNAELHIGLNQQKINTTLRKIYFDLTLGMIIIGIISLFIVMIMGNRISRPLVKFTQQLKNPDSTKEFELQNLTNLDPDTRELISTFRKLIFDRVEAEKELQLHRDHLEDLVAERTLELQVAIKELESFSYSVSHDLRSPLRGIDGFSLALLEDYESQLDDQGKEYLRRVRKGVQKMGKLIDDLLLLSRASRETLKRNKVNISAMAHSAIEQLVELNPERNVVVDIQPDMIDDADENLLGSVIDNLVGNAWKYSSHEEEARIDIGRRFSEGINIYFIKDNGVGIDMQFADKLFGAFQRLHGEEFEGTGIGLATVERIIRRHGGKVWVESEPELGSIFLFTLHA